MGNSEKSVSLSTEPRKVKHQSCFQSTKLIWMVLLVLLVVHAVYITFSVREMYHTRIAIAKLDSAMKAQLNVVTLNSDDTGGEVGEHRTEDDDTKYSRKTRSVPSASGTQGSVGRTEFGRFGCRCRGPPGEPGRDGAPGPVGASGQRGRSGSIGPPGREGPTGIPGQPGRDGEPGAIGQKGNRGPPGAPGQDGRTGMAGMDGRDGSPGASGSSGFDGQSGAPGERGPRGESRSTSTFVNWGKEGCTENTVPVYSGFAAAAEPFRGSGGASELECLPSRPNVSSATSAVRPTTTRITAVKFSLGRLHDRIFRDRATDNSVVTCTVCIARTRSPAVMIPGQNECPDSINWEREYRGYLMSSPGITSQFYCVNENPDLFLDGSPTNSPTPKLTFVQPGTCAGNRNAPCNAYRRSQRIPCVVCTRDEPNA